MADSAVARLWRRVRQKFDADAAQLHRIFLPEPDGIRMTPNDSYLRLWLSELFLAKAVEWGVERSPAVQASVRLLFDGVTPKTFATLAQPKPQADGHGIAEDYQLTELLPYLGQSVELEAGLYEILGANNLRTAIDIVTDFASLVVPPVSAALTVVDKVASGIEKVITANATDPVLALHGTLAAPGGGLTNELRPGWLAVVRATEAELPAASLQIRDGRLHRDGHRLTGFDYMVLRVEGRATREDWRTPDLDRAVMEALYARDIGRAEEFERLRAEALSRIYFSADLTPGQRKQVAVSVKEEMSETAPGAVALGEMTLAAIVERRGLPARQEVRDLTLEELLTA
jgi:hypothetical protein